MINVEFDLSTDNDFLLEVYDATGKKVKEMSLFEFAGKKRIIIQTNDLSPGLYFIHFTMDEQRTTERFIVKH